jgi:hypothetical protein
VLIGCILAAGLMLGVSELAAEAVMEFAPAEPDHPRRPQIHPFQRRCDHPWLAGKLAD